MGSKGISRVQDFPRQRGVEVVLTPWAEVEREEEQKREEFQQLKKLTKGSFTMAELLMQAGWTPGEALEPSPARNLRGAGGRGGGGGGGGAAAAAAGVRQRRNTRRTTQALPSSRSSSRAR